MDPIDGAELSDRTQIIVDTMSATPSTALVAIVEP